MFYSLLPIFGSKMKAQEILLLLHHAKTLVRQGFYEHELPKVQKFCQQNNLFIEISRFKVLLANETDFTNKGLRLSLDDPRPGMFFIYISKDEERTLRAHYYELVENHLDLGLLLGYPSCCVQFFVQNFTSKKTNLELIPTNPYTNLSQRKNDWCILSHFPCRSVCEKSVELGKRYLQILKDEDSTMAERLLAKLDLNQKNISK